MIPKGPLYSRKKALSIILVLTLLLSGSYALFLWSPSVLSWQSQTPVRKLISPGPLPALLIEEMLELSCDQGESFDCALAKQRLLNIATFKRVEVERVGRDTLLVDYELRTPLFLVDNWTHLAIDEHGVCFPTLPYLSAEKLARVRFTAFETDPKKEEFELALRLHERLPEKEYLLDLTRISSPSAGRREILLHLGEDLVRLPVANLEASLANYFLLRKTVETKRALIVDLRIPETAYLGGRDERTDSDSLDLFES